MVKHREPPEMNLKKGMKRIWAASAAPSVVIIMGKRMVDVLFDDLVSGVSGNYVEILYISDLHLGSKESDVKLFKRHLKMAYDRGAYIVLMGDLLDASLRDSIGAGVYDSTMRTQDQLDEIISILAPYKNRILLMTTGNHSERIYKSTGIDVMKVIADRLGVEYVGYESPVHYKVGKHDFFSYVNHGATGSTTKAGKIRAIMRYANIYPFFDTYHMGHVHDLMHTSRMVYVPSKGGESVEEKEQHFFINGHYLDYGGYASKKGYQPGKKGAWLVRYYDNGKIEYQEMA